MNPVVTVYRESTIWDGMECWWMIKPATLHDLYVATYECDVDEYGAVIDPVACIEEIRREHPNCVLVY